VVLLKKCISDKCRIKSDQRLGMDTGTEKNAIVSFARVEMQQIVVS